MTDRLTELEWLVIHEPNRELRQRHIRAFNDLWEQIHGCNGSGTGSREGCVRAVREDRGPSGIGQPLAPAETESA